MRSQCLSPLLAPPEAHKKDSAGEKTAMTLNIVACLPNLTALNLFKFEGLSIESVIEVRVKGSVQSRAFVPTMRTREEWTDCAVEQIPLASLFETQFHLNDPKPVLCAAKFRQAAKAWPSFRGRVWSSKTWISSGTSASAPNCSCKPGSGTWVRDRSR